MAIADHRIKMKIIKDIVKFSSENIKRVEYENNETNCLLAYLNQLFKTWKRYVKNEHQRINWDH